MLRMTSLKTAPSRKIIGVSPRASTTVDGRLSVTSPSSITCVTIPALSQNCARIFAGVSKVGMSATFALVAVIGFPES